MLTIKQSLTAAYRYLAENLLFLLMVAGSTLWYYYRSSGSSVTQADNLTYWTYTAVGGIWESALKHPLASVITLTLGIALQTLIGLYLAYGLRDMFKKVTLRRAILLKAFAISDYAWLLSVTLLIYIVFGVIAVSAYAPAYNLWHQLGADYSVALLTTFLILFPLYYLLISVSSFVAVIPSSPKVKTGALLRLLRPRPIAVLYAFYTVRIAAEAFLLLLAPWLSVRLGNPVFGIVLAVIILAFPLSYLRAVSFQVRLNTFKGDPLAKGYFS
ncbi:MAG: hypothetical protein V1826_03035 [bacterium]